MEFVGSVDLTNGKASILMGLPSRTISAETSVAYNPSWNLDSTTQMFVCVDAATGGLLAFCQARYTYFWYTYTSSDSAFQYYGAFARMNRFGRSKNNEFIAVLVSLYTLTEGNTTNFTDSSPYSVPNGPTAFGKNLFQKNPNYLKRK